MNTLNTPQAVNFESIRQMPYAEAGVMQDSDFLSQNPIGAIALAAHSGAVSATWRKSTRCESHACVEVARAPEIVAIRNSNQPEEHIAFAAPVWRAFVAGVRAGEFDTPLAT